jgi:conjugative transfer signal peptidase TraF
MKAKHVVGGATVFLTCLSALTPVLWHLGMRVNLSRSEPIGLYWMQPYQEGGVIRKGDLVEFCPAIQQSDYPFTLNGPCEGGTLPFLKTVIGVPGDLVQASDEGLRINRQSIADSQPKARSKSQQVALPHWQGEKRLGQDEYWVYGSGDPKNSFDSRYYGPITTKQIISVREKP